VKKLKAIAIIPARGGSKRIPKKNIKRFLGRPIIAYSISGALGSGCFDEVMVSTDSEEIKKVSLKYKAKVPFLRSAKNASDHAPIADAVLEVIESYRGQGVTFKYFCCILPTVPTISPGRIAEAYQTLRRMGADAVMPVVEYEHPVQRMLKTSGAYIKMVDPDNKEKRSQDLPPMYHDAGRFVWVKTESFLKQKTFFMKKTVPMFFDRIIVQDIDSEQDWKIAEMKFLMKSKTIRGRLYTTLWKIAILLLALSSLAWIMALIIY